MTREQAMAQYKAAASELREAQRDPGTTRKALASARRRYSIARSVWDDFRNEGW